MLRPLPSRRLMPPRSPPRAAATTALAAAVEEAAEVVEATGAPGAEAPGANGSARNSTSEPYTFGAWRAWSPVAADSVSPQR